MQTGSESVNKNAPQQDAAGDRLVPQKRPAELQSSEQPTVASITERQWMQSLDTDLVKKIPYQFAKRHEVLAINNVDGTVQVLCVQRPTLDAVTELRRRLGARLRFHNLGQDRFDQLLWRMGIHLN